MWDEVIVADDAVVDGATNAEPFTGVPEIMLGGGALD
jgi:hypothetical protein